ncbi:MAG TPA: galactokinase [Chitinophagaceae bacterium]|nr:galactokinase [Chitinophagaceae bacterium]
MTKEALAREFQTRYQQEPEYFFFCPGRVNLIGEHIDYNGGKVMPCAISLGTYLLVSKNTDKKIRFQCINFPEAAALQLQSSYSKTGSEWFNYPLGVINEMLQLGHELSGMNMLFYGNLPIGAGLSSSASIEVCTGTALSQIFGLSISGPDMAVLSKKVENEFIGMNCGIMDQFAVAMGKKDKAILLNCDTLDYEYLSFDIGDHVLAIINSNKERKLTDSKYNERFAECGRALKKLKQVLPAENLCDISVAEFEKAKNIINDPVLEKRALHVITENERVSQSKEALINGELSRFGELMYASHQSLKELYEVSGIELDTIVEFSKTYKDCIGARMTGAGFGGCAIALVKKGSFDDFAAKLIPYYKERVGYEPEIFASEIGDGARKI